MEPFPCIAGNVASSTKPAHRTDLPTTALQLNTGKIDHKVATLLGALKVLIAASSKTQVFNSKQNWPENLPVRLLVSELLRELGQDLIQANHLFISPLPVDENASQEVHFALRVGLRWRQLTPRGVSWYCQTILIREVSGG